jgi:hypothetical protein
MMTDSLTQHTVWKTCHTHDAGQDQGGQANTWGTWLIRVASYRTNEGSRTNVHVQCHSLTGASCVHVYLVGCAGKKLATGKWLWLLHACKIARPKLRTIYKGRIPCKIRQLGGRCWTREKCHADTWHVRVQEQFWGLQFFFPRISFVFMFFNWESLRKTENNVMCNCTNTSSNY